MTEIGHNSKDLDDSILSSFEEMVEIDRKRKVLNREAADIREALKDKGIDTDAFGDVYRYFKKKRHERDGYDESNKLCFDVLNKAETGDLFAPLDDKE